MRTTVTLDPDVEARLRQVMRERGVSFKDAVNDAIRAGLQPARAKNKRFVQRTFSLGLRPGIDLIKGLQLSAKTEDDELLRKMELRK